MPQDDRYLTPQELMTALGISTPTYYRWLREGRIVGVRAGRRWQFPERLVAELRAEGPEAAARKRNELAEAIEVFRPEAAGPATGAELARGLIDHAAAHRATAVHLDPTLDGLAVRERIDGQLVPVGSPMGEGAAAPLRRAIKELAGLDPAAEARPQFARFRTESGGQMLHVEAATYPTRTGESMTLSLINARQRLPTLEQAELPPALIARIRERLRDCAGIFFVCGPSGSGKSTTIYSLLDELRSPQRKIMTAEDPVVYELDGIQQAQISDGGGFVEAMAAMLRADVDVALISEIRDAAAMRMAFQVAATGHLVLSVLHAHDAISALIRMVEVDGVPRTLVADGLLGILNQRLVRKSCPDCRELAPVRADHAARLGLAEGSLVATNAGCARCNRSGLRGRMAVAELLTITDALRASLEAGSAPESLRAAVPPDALEISDQLRAAVARGEVTAAEAIRVR